MEMTREMWLIVLLVSLSGLTFLVTEREERQKLKQQIRKEMIQL